MGAFYFEYKEAENMRIIDNLSIDQRNKLLTVTRSLLLDKRKKHVKNKKEEQLSKRDLHFLMGTKRDTYRRVNGAMKRR
jgi:hypothetical protein